MWKLLLVLLSVGLCAGGFLNYRRNEHLDNELQNRLYADMSDKNLAALIAAYQEQVAELAAQVSEAPQGQDELDGYAPSDIHGKVRGFESFQQYNQNWRRSRAELFEQETALEELQREQSIRERGLDKSFNRVKRRVLTL